MYPDESALLAAVCAAPDDDLPRLVFADWCDEHGQPLRAEFVRTQIELAKLTRDSKRRRKLAFRCRELIDTAEDHLHNLPDTLPPEPWSFRRGFVELLEVEGMHLDSDAAAFRTHPVRRLHSINYIDIADLKHIPADNHLLTLTLTGNAFGTDDVVGLSRMKRFPHLTELGLMCCELDDEAARVLCDRAFFQRLKVLRVGGNPFTDAGRQLLRDHFGERVSFTCERDPEHLYAFHHEDRFTVGFGKDHTQLLMLAGPDTGSVAVFDHAGNLLRIDPKPGRGKAAPHEVRQRWLKGYGGEPGTIRVKRFKFPDGIGIEDFAPGWVEELEDPNTTERDTAQEWFSYWLDEGKFRWNWVGDDWWLNRGGTVTDT
jgi:uncharacterized protein (TIGR02996 family)